MKTSKFYRACRTGDIKTVEELLSTLSLDEINQFEPNGSTALHCASCYGHAEIVKQLLDKGASRSLKNKYGKTAADEAATMQIKVLFNRPFHEATARYVTETQDVEWNIVDEEISSTVWHTRKILNKHYWDVDTAFQELSKAEELQYAKGKEQIQYHLEKLRETQDAIWLLRLYTAETDFYRILNYLSADTWETYSEATLSKWYVVFANTLRNSDSIKNFLWKGKCYRGMHIKKEDLCQYKEGYCIMNKSFLSTSKNREVAQRFLSRTPPDKIGVMCIYESLNWEAFFDIQSISQFPEEEEVLIFPNTGFDVKRITHDEPVEIELELGG
ncbi:unnamed protein product [Adineta steineri]|uniref:NAD(P)(+)--arginine ADP-ribosyltransferase n=1 Tax=Adineta steineri TaxID=433720 RepID=A0A815YCF3_9BILA|nr:unnamed protein product [Adineta steineri]CAF1568355.1 unnamed protein product [Adineta steineri]